MFLTLDWMELNGKKVRFGIKKNKYGEGVVLVGIAENGTESSILMINKHGLHRLMHVSDRLGIPLTRNEQKVLSK